MKAKKQIKSNLTETVISWIDDGWDYMSIMARLEGPTCDYGFDKKELIAIYEDAERRCNQ